MKPRLAEKGAKSAAHLMSIVAAGAVSIESLGAMVGPIVGSSKVVLGLAPAGLLVSLLSPALAITGGLIAYLSFKSQSTSDAE